MDVLFHQTSRPEDWERDSDSFSHGSTSSNCAPASPSSTASATDSDTENHLALTGNRKRMTAQKTVNVHAGAFSPSTPFVNAVRPHQHQHQHQHQQQNRNGSYDSYGAYVPNSHPNASMYVSQATRSAPSEFNNGMYNMNAASASFVPSSSASSLSSSASAHSGSDSETDSWETPSLSSSVSSLGSGHGGGMGMGLNHYFQARHAGLLKGTSTGGSMPASWKDNDGTVHFLSEEDQEQNTRVTQSGQFIYILQGAKNVPTVLF
jgi:hypothetical protein